MIADPLDSEFLEALQLEAFSYFVHEANRFKGLIADKTQAGSPASIAAIGFALTCYPVGVERGFVTRADAVQRTLATLRFFHESAQSINADATGYRGFYYHFLDMVTGKRAWNCELSTIDTALLLAGMLTAAEYFSGDNADEREIRELTDALYRRVDWNWACNGGATVSLGWRPERGFLRYRWQGYNEALILYLLGLGSPTHPLPDESYPQWTATYQWRKFYDLELLYAGPLFIHQFPHVWVDLRGVQDDFMRGKGSDYFENSRRATHLHRQYSIANPSGFLGYGENAWGLTASDGPGPSSYTFKGIRRRYFDYMARGAPEGPDDGSLAPWAVAASLPFAPEIVVPALRYFETLNLRDSNRYGFKATFNDTMGERPGRPERWSSPFHFGINQGPLVLMIENFRTELIWRLMRRCPPILTGLRRAGFKGGWLDGA